MNGTQRERYSQSENMFLILVSFLFGAVFSNTGIKKNTYYLEMC